MPDIRPKRHEAPRQLVDRLEAIHDWYRGMVSEETGRLVYQYDPESDAEIANGHPIRNIAAIHDMERVSHFLESEEMGPVVERSLEHYAEYITSQNGGLMLDSKGLGEPSNIAHSAFMILALAVSDSPAREPTINGLAEGILDQQREDGSYQIFFRSQQDEGVELYPGEAMLALMHTYEIGNDPGHLMSVERGFEYYRRRFTPENVSDELRVFYSNWASQYGAMLHGMTDADLIREGVEDYLFALHDQTVESGYYERLDEHAHEQTTVEVASALEGLNEAYTVAQRVNDDERVEAYGECIRTTLNWLFDAQRLETENDRERGGFGHSTTDRTQRIDVTGHAASGLIKSARNGLEP